MIYCYTIKGNKELCYNTTGFFRCPKDPLKKDPTDYSESGRHSSYQMGNYQTRILKDEKRGTPEGIVREQITLRFKITRKTPPKCSCGEEMSWEGYPVWYKWKDPKAKMIGGMFRFGGNDKHYWTKRFKKRKTRQEFIKKFLIKHK